MPAQTIAIIVCKQIISYSFKIKIIYKLFIKSFV